MCSRSNRLLPHLRRPVRHRRRCRSRVRTTSLFPITVDVNAPVDKVWARVGKFCDYGEWSANGGPNTCKIVSGSDGEFGAIRSVGNEVLAGKTQYSYTYAQAPREGVPYNLYHGTVDAMALTDKTTRVTYTLFFDNSMLADDAARNADIESRRTRFTKSMGNMKILAEGGRLPPPPPRADAGTAGGTPAAARPAQAALMSPNPHYVSVPMTIEVNAPVDKVWARIGKFCDIGEWGIPGCTLLSGTDGEFGAVRSIGNEVLVGKTKYSYTYTQPLRATGGYIMYNGTLEARAITPATTQINYTLLYDNSAIADDKRDAEMEGPPHPIHEDADKYEDPVRGWDAAARCGGWWSRCQSGAGWSCSGWSCAVEVDGSQCRGLRYAASDESHSMGARRARLRAQT